MGLYHCKRYVGTRKCADETTIRKAVHKQGLSDPIEMLRFLQKELVQGRDLDVTSESELKEGETNYIRIDRYDILKTTFTELRSIENFHITFDVDFLGEKARDLGGPRKE